MHIPLLGAMRASNLNISDHELLRSESVSYSLMIKALADITYRQGRRLVVIVTGGSLLLLGVALIFLPGPAFIVIPAGLAVLALEFAWAKRFLHRIRREISERNRLARLSNRD